MNNGYLAPMDLITLRLSGQQLISPQFSDPAELVCHMGAVQAQEYRLMRWTVAMRTRRASLADFTRAFDSGRIVRLHLFRGTWQLISGRDYWWMLDLASPKARSVINGWMSANKISIPEDEYRAVGEILQDTALRLGSATKEDFALALESEGWLMDDHRLSYHIREAELKGVLCSGDLHPMKATYSLSEKKMGTREHLDRDEALALLARKYFRSHGPATLEDFVWWCGLGKTDCRRAMALLGGELREENLNGVDYYMVTSVRRRVSRKGSTILLPSYDEYLIGYKSREWVLPPEYSHLAHNRSGIFYPVILKDGKVCGNWSPFAKQPQPTFFEPGDADAGVPAAWASYMDFKKR